MKWLAGGAAVATVPALVACGGGGGGSAGGGDEPSGGSDFDEQRFEAIADVEEMSRRIALTALTPLEFVQTVAAYMNTLGAYTRTGFDDETLCAWGIFQDGRTHIVANNRLPAPALTTPLTTPLAGDAAPAAAPREHPQASGLPRAPQARLLHTFGTGFDDGQSMITDLTAWLTPAGYQVRSGGQEGDGRLTALRAVKGDGFFYINTHGGWGDALRADGSETGGTVFSIQSSTLVDKVLERTPEMREDLADGRLTYFTARNGLTKTILGVEYPDHDTRYGITDKFVRAHWQFAPNSVVIINACVSGLAMSRGRPLAAPFYDACLAKGAGAYLGWTNTVSATGAFTVPRRFVDRVLGANAYQPESPKQRAFVVSEVMGELNRKGLDRDTAGTAVFVLKANADAPTVVPGIREMIVDEFRDELVLLGDFGPQETTGPNTGRVTVDGQERSVLSWTATRIVCALPRSGAGSAGPVRVQVGPHASNVRWITRWTTTLDYRWEDPQRPGLRVTGVATIRHRADVGKTRAQPGDAPLEPLRYAVATRDSSLPLQAQGSFNGGPDCTFHWSGAMTYPGTHLTNGHVFFADLKIDTASRTGALGLALGATGPDFTETGCGRDPSQFAVAFLQLQQVVEFARYNNGQVAMVPVPAVDVSFDANFMLAAGSLEQNQLHLSWTSAAPEFAPQADDAI
ncbi:MAG: hypothetical protein KF891_05645 [Rhizobacter sp.]|nr:hypothetical protein [Rhizobacter sp.]